MSKLTKITTENSMIKIPQIHRIGGPPKEVIQIRLDNDMKYYVRKEAKSLRLTKAGLIRWCVQYVKENNITSKLYLINKN